MSNRSSMTFAEDMLSRSAFLRDHCHDLEEFMDSENPLPISLLGQFGGVIANNFEALAPNEWAALAAMIEQGLTSDDDDVSTAVATGLIEGMIHRAEAIDNLWPRIEAGLGSKARSYADAYRSAE